LPEDKKSGNGRPKEVGLGKARFVARLRKVADEEEAAGANEIAAEFRQRADEIEAGMVVPIDDEQLDG
jgi:hypothetical protein